MKHLLFLSIFITSICKADISNLQLTGLKKESVGKEHVRFEGSNLVVHIKKESSGTNWNQETFKKDAETMIQMRMKILETFGNKNINFKPVEFSQTPQKYLKISGSYERPDGSRISYSDFNFYFKNYFLLVKIMKKDSPLSDAESKKITDQIDLKKVI